MFMHSWGIFALFFKSLPSLCFPGLKLDRGPTRASKSQLLPAGERFNHVVYLRTGQGAFKRFNEICTLLQIGFSKTKTIRGKGARLSFMVKCGRHRLSHNS